MTATSSQDDPRLQRELYELLQAVLGSSGGSSSSIRHQALPAWREAVAAIHRADRRRNNNNNNNNKQALELVETREAIAGLTHDALADRDPRGLATAAAGAGRRLLAAARAYRTSGQADRVCGDFVRGLGYAEHRALGSLAERHQQHRRRPGGGGGVPTAAAAARERALEAEFERLRAVLLWVLEVFESAEV